MRIRALLVPACFTLVGASLLHCGGDDTAVPQDGGAPGKDATVVDAVLNDGQKIVADVDRNGQKGLAELSYRRRGLALSLGAILLVVVGLALKVRQIDRRHT